MYKFIIRGVDSSIKYKDIIGSTSVSSCQKIGRALHKMKLLLYPSKYHVSDIIDVVDASVDVSPYKNSIIAHTRTHFNIQ